MKLHFAVRPLLLCVALLLAGCTASDPAPIVTEEPTLELSSAVTGQEIPVAEISKYQLINGEQFTFSHESGNYIVVNKAEPLPATVLQQLTETLTAFSDTPGPEREALTGVTGLFTEITRDTGKQAILIWRNLQQSNNVHSGWNWQVMYRDPLNANIAHELGRHIGTRAAAEELAQEFLEQQTSSEHWVIIIANEP